MVPKSLYESLEKGDTAGGLGLFEQFRFTESWYHGLRCVKNE